MNEDVPRMAPRGPHGGSTRVRPGQAMSDDELIGSWQTFRRVMGLVDGRLATSSTGRDHQPSAVQEALARLAVAPDRALPMSELAAAVGISTGSLTKLVDRLVQAGLAFRHHSTSDRRVIYAVLTDEGAAYERRSTPVYAEELRAEFDRLGPDGLRALRAVCHRIEEGFGRPRSDDASRAVRG